MNKRKEKIIIASIFAVLIIGLGFWNLYLYQMNQADLEDNSTLDNIATEDEVIVIKVPEIKGADIETTDTGDQAKPDEVNEQETQASPTYPEGMEQPAKEVTKPADPPVEDNVVVTAPVITKTPTNPQPDNKPVTTTTQKPEQVKGGTGADGVLRDLNGNPITDLTPATNVQEVNGSDLDGQFEMGEGDKF
ncbi:MAG: hypothetical protein CVV02_01660 [Firmicutes bacterium HGW-Firmicutes-7]|nr:MAG: hypothetical protein CVV02_01660 [Firmicutes bacterium HGW-Firmicutes-7]